MLIVLWEAIESICPTVRKYNTKQIESPKAFADKAKQKDIVSASKFSISTES